MKYVILGPSETLSPKPAELESALNELGMTRWEFNGTPDICIFNHQGPKGDYFEAGFWAGQGVHVFYIGGGTARTAKRKQIVNRFGGWSLVEGGNFPNVEFVADAVKRWAHSHGKDLSK